MRSVKRITTKDKIDSSNTIYTHKTNKTKAKAKAKRANKQHRKQANNETNLADNA